MQLVALNWQVYEITHSALALGAVGMLRFIPILIFSLIGGSVADAHNRKKILYTAESILAFLALVLAYITFSHRITAELIFIMTAFTAAILSFDNPARQSFVPNLIPKKNLANGMSLFSIFFQISMIIGPAFAGFFIAKSGPGLVYVANTISFLFILGGLRFIKTSGRPIGEGSQVSIQAIKEGLAFVRSKTMIWSTMLLDFFSTFFSGATALLPIFAKDILHVGPVGLGLLYAADSVGAVIAGFILAHKHNLRKQGVVLLTSITFYALGTIMLGFSKILFVSLIALVVLGAGDGISTIIRNTIRQLETPDYIRGRMGSINMIFFMGGPQLGDFEAGTLASVVGAPASVVIGGIGTLIVIAIMTLKIPTLRKYSHYQEIKSAE